MRPFSYDDAVRTIETETLGEAWLETCRVVLDEGDDGLYDGLAMREVANLSIAVAEPDSRDPTIAALADPEWLAWMHANFTLELVVYAHSLDFGKKAYGNLVELAALQERVAGELEVPVGRLLVHAKSAHVYDSEREAMAALAAARA
jgi:hypothetical protein